MRVFAVITGQESWSHLARDVHRAKYSCRYCIPIYKDISYSALSVLIVRTVLLSHR